VTLKPWDIHYFEVEFPNQDGTVLKRNKYILIINIDHEDWFYGLIINTNIPNFVAKKPKLKVCTVGLRLFVYPFLELDCHVDCTKLHTFKKTNCTRSTLKGPLKEPTITEITEAFKECPVAENFYIKKFNK